VIGSTCDQRISDDGSLVPSLLEHVVLGVDEATAQCIVRIRFI
jgi:hypothetical protein